MNKMAKLNKDINIKLNKDILKNIEKRMKELIEKVEKKKKEQIIEKVAFSLFITSYYKHEFTPGESNLYYEIHLEKMKNMWILGKQKNKLKFFFDLAYKIYNLNLNNIDLNKENNNDKNV